MGDKKTRKALADDALLAELAEANEQVARDWPGEPITRQPVHTVYGGAHLFRAETAGKLGELALRSLEHFAPDGFAFARALELEGYGDGSRAARDLEDALRDKLASDPEALRRDHPSAWLALTLYERVVEKLKREPVEDFRIDFEDGFGNRPDEEEDAVARQAAREVAVGMAQKTLPPFIGIRIKPLSGELAERSIRTLELFVDELAQTADALPEHFVVTLPKITTETQVSTLAKLLRRLEKRHGLAKRSLKIELMIEVTQSIMDARGRCALPRLLDAADGRCTGAHFGTYDYTASCNITAAYQTMDHPSCRFALEMMKIAYAGRSVHLSDGATNVMPVPPHGGGGELTPSQRLENAEVVHNAWRVAWRHTRGSLERGIYQGWDLHPAQLPVRYAATYAFFLEGFAAAAERLRNFMDKAAQATLVGDVFDDAATGQGLLNYFLCALNCGAVSLDELAVTGLSHDEIRTRSFVKILDGRRA